LKFREKNFENGKSDPKSWLKVDNQSSHVKYRSQWRMVIAIHCKQRRVQADEVKIKIGQKVLFAK
jgi:hypothetical protein